MFIADDATYFAEREQTERRLAANAKDEAARAAHLMMAAEYCRRAEEARHVAAASLERSGIIAFDPARRGVSAPSHRRSSRRHQRRATPAGRASAAPAGRAT